MIKNLVPVAKKCLELVAKMNKLEINFLRVPVGMEGFINFKIYFKKLFFK